MIMLILAIIVFTKMLSCDNGSTEKSPKEIKRRKEEEIFDLNIALYDNMMYLYRFGGKYVFLKDHNYKLKLITNENYEGYRNGPATEKDYEENWLKIMGGSFGINQLNQKVWIPPMHNDKILIEEV